MIKYLLSLILGSLSGYLPNMIFNLVVNKAKLNHIVIKMYLAEACKIVAFILILLIVFKFVPVEPKLFIISVIGSVIMNFTRNLLKLIL